MKVEKQGPYEHKTAEVVWRYLMCGNCGKSASASFIPPTFNRWPLEQKPKAKEHFKAHLNQSLTHSKYVFLTNTKSVS